MANLNEKEEKNIRPPVVAVLGHIDHGKSTLIDYIRKTNVTGTEAGGITQHISAYEITHTTKDGRDKQITFLDTPGHEAFSSIRTRGSDVADIAVLVVSAEDGVKPQTLEIIKYLKTSSVPLLVVISKIDKPSADVLRTKQDLAENEVFVEGYGGNTPVVEVSSKTGKGVDEFLDMICLIADLENFTADKEALGSGVIIETHCDSKRGITAIGIIKDGTVNCGLFASSIGTIAPIRFILDAEGKIVDELSFSSPIQITGWTETPKIGREFKTFLKKNEALNFANEQENEKPEDKVKNNPGEGVRTLPIVLKADASGSLEAIIEELKKISRERIIIKVILSGIGKITENDVKATLSATEAIILGFNTKVDSQAAALAERLNINILNFNIIYELTDKIKELLAEREPKIEVEEIASTAKILKTFGITKGKQVLGGRVLSGVLKNGAVIKIIRRDSELGKGKIKELQQSKVEASLINEGEEFGAMIESKIEIVPGDILNTIVLVTK